MTSPIHASVLDIRNLSVEFSTHRGRLKALRDVTLTVPNEKIVGPMGLVILGAIALSFVFFGATLNFAGNVYAAKVNGSEIGLAQFENTYRQQLEANPQLVQHETYWSSRFLRSAAASAVRLRGWGIGTSFTPR